MFLHKDLQKIYVNRRRAKDANFHLRFGHKMRSIFVLFHCIGMRCRRDCEPGVKGTLGALSDAKINMSSS